MKDSSVRIEKATSYLKKIFDNFRIENIEYTGANSTILKVIEYSGRTHALKLYPKALTSANERRQYREVNALKELVNRKYMQTPKIEIVNREDNWTLMNWVEGEKPKNITDEYISEVIKLIKISHINQKETNIDVGNASESLLRKYSIQENLSKRIRRLEEYMPTGIVDIATSDWAKMVLVEECNRAIKNLSTRMESTQWKERKEYKIISHSDYGLHNTLMKDDKYWFIDFEYAGQDDICKAIADIVCQPDNNISTNQETRLIEGINKLKLFNESWLERYKDIKRITALKWCMIMLNPIYANRMSKDREIKIKRYFENLKTESISN